MYEPIEIGSRSRRTFSAAGRILGALKLDGPLLVGLGLITLYGLVVLYSASGQNWNRVIDGTIRAALGGVAMCALAQVKPAFLRRLATIPSDSIPGCFSSVISRTNCSMY
jgi:cell division protein FtsW (lipid II flippase)